ncbi:MULTISPECIES: hypothetical protein [Streptomyces]|uniref:hypothetical protein n=1 Tax=Streptomyces TaxID=1883 RepID=UPI00224931C6|nr:hypothetical protein [Streptomyces sp. JHD 1]MCX2967410.1 hypothetical protein [Streptomyces sp. JHD 1]
MLSARKAAFGAASAALAGTVTLTLVGVAGAGPADRPAAAPLPGTEALADRARQLDHLGELMSSVSELVDDVLEAPRGRLSAAEMTENRRDVGRDLRRLRRTLDAAPARGDRAEDAPDARERPERQSVEVGGREGVRVEWDDARDQWRVDFDEWSVGSTEPTGRPSAAAPFPSCLPVQLPDVGITYPTLPFPPCDPPTTPTGTPTAVPTGVPTGLPTGAPVTAQEPERQAPAAPTSAHAALDELREAVDALLDASAAREAERTGRAADTVLRRLDAVMTALADGGARSGR